MEEKSKSRYRCFFTTVVWGNRHVQYLVNYNIPTMLAPGNLPAFAAAIDTSYTIYTTKGDREIIESSFAFQRLRQLIKIEFRNLEATDIGVPVETHYRIWQQEIDQAAQSSSFVFLMPPDVVWSDGSFGYLAKLILAGKEAIFLVSHLRSVTETFLPAFEAKYPKDVNTIISVSSRALVELALEHAHPMTGAYLRNSLFFPHHSELIVWPVADEGLLVHVLALVPTMFRPDRQKLTQEGLLKEVADPGRLHCVTDSDNLYMTSLTELGKDTDWYKCNGPLSDSKVARWWLQYDSPSNDIIVREPFRIHFAECTKAAWRHAELSAKTAVHRLLAARDCLRLIDTARELKCHRAADLLSFVLQVGLSHRIVHSAGPYIFLIPTDTALDGLWEIRGQIFVSEKISALIDLLRNHCVPVPQVQDLGQKHVITIQSSDSRNVLALRTIPELIKDNKADAVPADEFRRVGAHYAIVVPVLQKKSLELGPTPLEVAKPLLCSGSLSIINPELRRPCAVYRWYDRYYAVPASLGSIRPIELTSEGLNRAGILGWRMKLIHAFRSFPRGYLFFQPMLHQIPLLIGVCRQFERSLIRSAISLSALADNGPESVAPVVGFVDGEGFEYEIFCEQKLYFAVPVLIEDFSWRYPNLITKSPIVGFVTTLLARGPSLLRRIARRLDGQRIRRLIQYVLQERVISAQSLHELYKEFHFRDAASR